MFVLLGSRSTKLLLFQVWELLFILAVVGNVGGTSLEHLQLYACCGRDIQAVYFYGGDIHLWTLVPLPLSRLRSHWADGMDVTVQLQTINECVGTRFIECSLSPATVTAAAAAKSLQSCLTLCNPIDGLLPGSSDPGILQARTLEWVAIAFSNAWKWKVKVKLLSRVRLLATLWTAAHQAPLSVGFSRQEYWSRMPLPSPVFTASKW